jgi:hypothetical protein
MVFPDDRMGVIFCLLQHRVVFAGNRLQDFCSSALEM